jgi:hypothetical protein
VKDEAGLISATANPRATAFARLVVTDFPEQGAWRVHYRGAALSPRSVDLVAGPSTWNRFEVLKPEPTPPGSVYCGSERRGSFAEVLAHLRSPRIGELEALAADLDDVESDTPIADEWELLGFEAVGVVPADWCDKREISRIAHDPARPGTYVSVEHHETMAALNVVCRNLLIRQKAAPLNVSALRSTHRELTCGIATEIATCSLPLSTGARPDGFRYLSQHSTDWECWVTWPANNYGGLQIEASEPIRPDDPDFAYILDLFELRIGATT